MQSNDDFGYLCNQKCATEDKIILRKIDNSTRQLKKMIHYGQETTTI